MCFRYRVSMGCIASKGAAELADHMRHCCRAEPQVHGNQGSGDETDWGAPECVGGGAAPQHGQQS